MENKKFGNQLLFFRQQTLHPKTHKPLTQQQLGELLKEEIGIRYSGAAVSDWERNRSRINADERLLLTSLIKILKYYGGIKNLEDANLLLEAGNYRALNETERNGIFRDEIQEVEERPTTSSSSQQTPNIKFLLSTVLFNSPEGLQQMLNEANEGPAPAWPRIAVAIINKVTGQWFVFYILRLLIWFWIWWITYLLIAPSLRWPFATQDNALQAMTLYASGTIILPLLIGAMVNTKDQSFWKEQKISNTLTTRLYVHQGAFIGFQLGYFFIFPLALIQNQFGLQSTAWVEFIQMLIPVAIGYTAAQLVPYNLWRAYKRLQLKDGAVFFIFTILGPIWAWFFLQFKETIGIFTVLMAITLLTGAMAVQYRRKGNTTIPVLWVFIFYCLIFICQVASLFIK